MVLQLCMTSVLYVLGFGGSGSQVDSARMNLASSFVNGFVNAAFGQDKLLTDDGNKWLYKNKDHGKIQKNSHSHANCSSHITYWTFLYISLDLSDILIPLYSQWLLIMIVQWLKMMFMSSGMLSAAASLGMILLWDVDGGLTQIDKYLYSSEDYIKVNIRLESVGNFLMI